MAKETAKLVKDVEDQIAGARLAAGKEHDVILSDQQKVVDSVK